MYERITQNFKNALTDRRIDVRIVVLYTVFIVLYASVIISSMFSEYIWRIIGGAGLLLVAACIVSGYCIVFSTLKAKSNLTYADFFNFKKVRGVLKTIQPDDSQILISVLKEEFVDSREKISEAIKHFRFVLQRPRKSIDIIPLLALLVSVAAIFLSGKTYGSIKTAVLLSIMFAYLLIGIAMIVFGLKLIYKSTYYDLSLRALNERIMNVLSEIYMKELI